jgi:hypothetical protein
LRKLKPVEMDASKRQPCLQDTRVDLLRSIENWAVNASGDEKVFWLHGVAGSGKSTISTTIANSFRQFGHLGAFLFFDRDVATRSDPSTIIRTLAYQIGLFHPTIGDAIGTAIESTPTISVSPLNFQFQGLIVNPISSIPVLTDSLPILLILDALDECGNPKERRGLLAVLKHESRNLPSGIKILITSRDDLDICNAFEAQHHIRAQELDIASDINAGDVSLYISHRLSYILADNRYLGLASDWPGEERTRLLAKHACGLFVWASTATAFIEDGHDPDERLDTVLGAQEASASKSALDELYLTALKSVWKWEDISFQSDFLSIFGTIIAAKNPLTHSVIDWLLCSRRPSLHTISRFGCVLRWTSTDPVRILHPSFADFITNRTRCGDGPWFIDLSLHHRRLAVLCLDRLEKTLRHGLCASSFSWSQINNTIVQDALYATASWIYHVCLIVDDTATLAVRVDGFLHQHLLHWLEAMSLLRISRDAISLLNSLQKWAQVLCQIISAFHYD